MQLLKPQYSGLSSCIVAVDSRYFRPTEVESLLGNPSKAKTKLGWEPRISFVDMVSEMVHEGLSSAKPDYLVKQHGYEAMAITSK